jgi:hypothetical protein
MDRIETLQVAELERIGRGVEIRTPDLLRPRQAEYLLEVLPFQSLF